MVGVTAAATPADAVESWRRARVHGDRTIGGLIAGSDGQGDLVFSTRHREERITCADLVARAHRYAAGLRSIGVTAGDVVAVQLPSGVDSWALVGGAWLVGAILCPVVDIYGPKELGFILEESGAAVLAVSSDRTGEPGNNKARSAGFGGTVLTAGPERASGAIPLEGLLDEGVAPAAEGVDPDDVALVVYTSGSTASPKGVQHTHNTLLAGFVGAASHRTPTRSLATFPAGHIAGTLAALRTLVVGGSSVVMDRWSATRAAELIERYGIVSSAGTPFFLRGLLDAADRDGRDISSLGAFLTGAAPVPPALLERAEDRGILGWRTYGCSEHPSISSGGPTDDVATRHGTDGRLSPLVEVRFVDEELHDVPIGAEGEVVVRGPKQFVGYVDPSLNSDAFLPGGWFRTGDVGRLDEEGRLSIIDRRKDIIIRGGENIASKEVEDVLDRIDGLIECAVCAQPDAALGEVVAAFVRLEPDRDLTLDEVRRHFRSSGVAMQKAPEVLRVVADFPRTAAGKVLKTELRSSLEE